MDMHRWSLLVAAAAALLLSGCAAIPQQSAVKEVHICNTENCATVDQKYSAGQLLAGFQKLLKANEGEKVTICDSDPKTRACESVGICQFVLGGILPGNGCSQSMVFSEIAKGKQADQLSLKADMPLTFIWTPVECAATAATLSVRSPDEISLEFQPRFCAWMVVGTMSATFNFAVESIDMSHGQIGGYWSHAVKGTGNGRGSGYALLKFPKAMPSGENWLLAQPLPPVAGR
jgi:uncharacterized protein YceK